MPGLLKLSVIAVLVLLVIVRQFGAQEITADRRRWVLPVVLAVVALREPGTLDAHHRTLSAVLLGAELLVGLGIGSGWAWTTRVWAEPDGAVWSRSTRASMAVWGIGIALRAGLYALGAVLGVRQDSSALVPALAATLLTRSGFLALRARSLTTAAPAAAAYGDFEARPARKERV